MEHSFDLSISGRVFSKTGKHEDERDDSFSHMLARLHDEAASVGMKGGWYDPVRGTMFSPQLLPFISYAVSVYRCDCSLGFWDTGAFIDALNETEGTTEEGVGEKYFAGAILFCVDRALACYQRGRCRRPFDEAENWADCAQLLRFSLRYFSDPEMVKCDGRSASAVGRIAADARHAENRAKAESIKAWWRENKNGLSMDAAAEIAAKSHSVAFRTARKHIGDAAKQLRSARRV